jgi:hypothetical protein
MAENLVLRSGLSAPLDNLLQFALEHLDDLFG